MRAALKAQAHAAWERILYNSRTTDIMRAAVFPETPKILGSSVKIVKGESQDILTAVAYLSPERESGRNMCPWATKECAAACLGHSSGQMVFDSSRNARIWKTALFLLERETFWALVTAEIHSHVRKAARKNMLPAIRLNGTTDVIPAWEFARLFPEVTFYDYTKSFHRAVDHIAGQFPPNYHVTYSRSGDNDNECVVVLKHGGNVAVVFDVLPATWKGFPVINADDTDARFTDPPGTVAGLTFKGNKADVAGNFLVRNGG